MASKTNSRTHTELNVSSADDTQVCMVKIGQKDPNGDENEGCKVSWMVVII